MKSRAERQTERQANRPADGPAGRLADGPAGRILSAPEERRDRLVAALGLLLIYAAMLARFDLRLLFTDTIPTGGDTASWYQILDKLKNVFLPNFRLFGYSQSNFFGYMEGQQYFPLPFLAAALLGFAVPLPVALKIATMAGGFALPATLYIGVRSMTRSRKLGVAAASASLLFLFNESYTMFGGNWLSTFAGEFCYSWAIAILPLFVASVRKDERCDRNGFRSGILLGLIGLCHLFVFMPAFFLPFFPAFRSLPAALRRAKGRGARVGRPAVRLVSGKRTPGKRTPVDRKANGEIHGRRAGRILVTYLTAFCLMGFWLVPMIATRPWAQSIGMIWHFTSLADFAGQTLAAVWVPGTLILVGFVLLAGRRGKRSVAVDRAISPARSEAAFFVYGIAACAFLFAIAPGLGMPDIRFVPTAILLCLLGMASMTGGAASIGLQRRRESGPAKPAARTTGNRGAAFREPAAVLAVFAVVASGAVGARIMSDNAPAWFAWNYSGYEAKAQWPAMRTISDRYSGDMMAGRILWEKQDQRDNVDFGSERAFENLELFTGRPSTEGIHYGSSFMARAVTYLQSSYSLNPVDPEAERIYSMLDPDAWPLRFRQLNARHIITYSESVTALFAAHPRFRLDAEIGKFSVFESLDWPASYVELVPVEALSVVREGPGGWKTDYYRFFRDYEFIGWPFLSSAFADSRVSSLASFASYDDYRDARTAQAALGMIESDGRTPIASIRDERIDDFGVHFVTDKPGQPHVVKISFAPGWRSLSGEKLYPVSPGFILIVPTSNTVDLRYGRTGWEWLGLTLSLAGTPALLLFARRKKRSLPHWKAAFVLAFAGFAIAAGLLAVRTATGPAAIARDMEKARRFDLSKAADRAEALVLAERWATEETLDRYDNMLAFDAWRIKAEVLAREDRAAEASDIVDMLRARYPHSRAIQQLPATK